MGIYINTGNAGFQRARNSEYIDKSGLISVVNSTLFTERSFSCVTRSRRLGYLGYDWREDECYIPNREVAGEMAERLLLVGISYNRQTKTHDCQIEQSKA
jgi:hypothetical protein